MADFNNEDMSKDRPLGCSVRDTETQLKKTEEKRYSLGECEAIGKEMIDALKSAFRDADAGFRDRFSARSPSDPRVMAWKYLEERHVLRVLETVLSKVVYHQPRDPLQFMLNEMQRIKETCGQPNMDPCPDHLR